MYKEILSFIILLPDVFANEQYAAKTGKGCIFCHQDKTGGLLNTVGLAYIKNGYRYIHKDGKNWLEHRLVWRGVHGKIPKGFVIHHINGDKLDNRIENLELIGSNGEHIHDKHSDLAEYPRMNLSEKDLEFIRSHIAVDRIIG